jgi:hypothetical protein
MVADDPYKSNCMRIDFIWLKWKMILLDIESYQNLEEQKITNLSLSSYLLLAHLFPSQINYPTNQLPVPVVNLDKGIFGVSES